MSSEEYTLPNANDVYACIRVVADYARDPERSSMLKSSLAAAAVDAVVMFADTLPADQTIARSLEQLFDGSDEANEAREDLIGILCSVELPGNHGADRAREALGLTS